MENYVNRCADSETVRCRVLKRYVYECENGTTLKRKLPKAPILSIVAVEYDTAELLDLRSKMQEGRIVWEVPEGNWNVHIFTCETGSAEGALTEEEETEAEEILPTAAPTAPSGRINMLNYDTCLRYFRETCGVLLDRLGETAATVRLLVCRDVQFGGENRRMWSEDFNEVFREKFGFDPAPFYPCLFDDVGDNPAYYRALLMRCRAAMLSEGYMKAAADFAAGRGLVSTGYAIESKATACSWFCGDAQMLHRYTTAPGVSMPFGYAYGLNGVKVAAGAADGLGKGLLCADMFRRYPALTDTMLYKETLNVLSRGANLIMAHLGEDREKKSAPEDNSTPQSLLDTLFHNRAAMDYTEFCARSQMLLRGGTHICDIAVLYPIHSIHANAYLFELPENGFEYPATPEMADYMADMNNLLAYCGTDAEFLHPEILAEKCYAENGLLCRVADDRTERFSVLLMPAMTVCSVRALRTAAKFFDCGGRVLATGVLPEHAVEGEEFDGEIRDLCTHIFGTAATDRNTMEISFENGNENGGKAVFLMPTETAADGVLTVDAATLKTALQSLNYAPDVILTAPPVCRYSGMASYSLSVYRKYGIDQKVIKLGYLNILHKRLDLCHLWFLTNTTEKDCEDDIYLRGTHTPEEWNPYRGKIRRLSPETVQTRGDTYTKIRLTVPANSAVFIVSEE